MSKGSARRPKRISDAEEAKRWDAIFKKKVSKPVQDKRVEAAKASAAT